MINPNLLKAKLKEIGKTQTDLAQYVGVAVSTMNQKINGVRPLGIYEAEKIAKYLKISDRDFSTYFFGSASALRRK